eukprot:1964665-Prymnesium_polylepis.1
MGRGGARFPAPIHGAYPPIRGSRRRACVSSRAGRLIVRQLRPHLLWPQLAHVLAVVELDRKRAIRPRVDDRAAVPRAARRALAAREEGADALADG